MELVATAVLSEVQCSIHIRDIENLNAQTNYLNPGAHQGELLSPLIPWVNPSLSRSILRTAFFLMEYVKLANLLVVFISGSFQIGSIKCVHLKLPLGGILLID